jgi:hypothetical protein
VNSVSFLDGNSVSFFFAIFLGTLGFSAQGGGGNDAEANCETAFPWSKVDDNSGGMYRFSMSFWNHSFLRIPRGSP